MVNITKPRCKVFLDVIYDERVVEGIVKGQAYSLYGKTVNGSPLSCIIEKNDYQAADTCKIELSSSYFEGEIADDMFRSVRVTVHMDNAIIGSNDFIASESNLVFVGFADEITVVESESESKMSLECRDYTGLLMSRKLYGDAYNTTLKKGLGTIDISYRSIDDVIRTYLDLNPQTQQIGIVKIPQTLVLPRFKDVLEDQKTQQTADKDVSLWEHIVSLIRPLGLIAYIDNFNIVISESRYLYSREGSDPNIALYEYGENIKETTFKKQMGIKDIPIVDVRSYDAKTKTTLKAQYPLIEEDQTQIAASRSRAQTSDDKDTYRKVGVSEAEVQAVFENDDKRVVPYIIPGIKDPIILQKIAENLWIAASKHQTTGTISTKKSVVDTINGGTIRSQSLKNGDLVFVKTSDSKLKPRTYGISTTETALRKKNYIIGKAQGLPYFVLNNTIEFSAEEGVSFTIEVGEFIDYKRMLMEDNASTTAQEDKMNKTAGQSKLKTNVPMTLLPPEISVEDTLPDWNTIQSTLKAGQSKLPESHR